MPKRPVHRFDSVYPDVHDPVMAFDDGKYYIFSTGMGVGMMSSSDLKTWKPGPALSTRFPHGP